MESTFLANLACPSCLTTLQVNTSQNSLICTQEQLIYPIIDAIPVLLESAAKPVRDSL